MNLRQRLAHNLTEYDRKQSTRKGYNPYALPQYLGRIGEIMDDIENGADPHQAIAAGFSGAVLRAALKGTGLKPPAKEIGGMFYRPVSER